MAAQRHQGLTVIRSVDVDREGERRSMRTVIIKALPRRLDPTLSLVILAEANAAPIGSTPICATHLQREAYWQRQQGHRARFSPGATAENGDELFCNWSNIGAACVNGR